MPQQISFAQAEYGAKRKTTRRDRFLGEMERVVPWGRPGGVRLAAATTPRRGQRRGRPPIGLERMLRIYFLQQWYGLADEALEDAFYDSQAMRGLASGSTWDRESGARCHHAAELPPLARTSRS